MVANREIFAHCYNTTKEDIMSVNKQDLSELNRLATNTYDDDKKFIYRIINGIHVMEREILTLKAEIAKLKS